MPLRIQYSNRRNQKILIGSISLTASTTILLGVGLILAGLMARFFSAPEFGLWSILMSLNGIMIMGLDLGSGNTLRNKLVQLYGHNILAEREKRIF